MEVMGERESSSTEKFLICVALLWRVAKRGNNLVGYLVKKTTASALLLYCSWNRLLLLGPIKKSWTPQCCWYKGYEVKVWTLSRYTMMVNVCLLERQLPCTGNTNSTILEDHDCSESSFDYCCCWQLYIKRERRECFCDQNQLRQRGAFRYVGVPVSVDWRTIGTLRASTLRGVRKASVKDTQKRALLDRKHLEKNSKRCVKRLFSLSATLLVPPATRRRIRERE